MNSRLAFWGPPVASALLMLGAFAPFDFSLLVFVALVPWLRSLADGDGKRALKSGFVFGVVYMGGQMLWLQPFVSRWTGSTLLGTIPWVLGSAFAALAYAGLGWAVHACWKQQRPWLIPVVWAGVEVLRSYTLVIAFPWALAATPLWHLTPMIQTAHYGTVYAVSAWVLLANVIGARFVRGDGMMALRPGAMAFMALLALSLVRYATPQEGTLTTITVGQPGVDLAFGNPATQDADLALAVGELTLAAAAQNSRLLVLPEGVSSGVGYPPTPPFEVVRDVPVLFGGQRGTGDAAYQTAFAYDGDWTYADKTRLVIFGEFVPLRGVLPFLDAFDVPSGDLVPAAEVKTVEVAGLRVGPMLCFEGLFYDIAFKQAENGAQLIAVMSIDDWYMGTNAPDQLRAAAPFRAIEAGVPLVRAAATGYSLATDARGDLVAMAPLGKQVATTVRLKVPDKADVFPGLPVFPWFAALSLPAVVLWRWRKPVAEPVPVAPKSKKKAKRKP